MKRVLEQSGLKVAVLRASVDTARREDWILDQVDRGVDVLITNPELVKTGLDLLDFPTIAFMQTGYNVYTVQQAARRSWRIGQKQDVRVIFFRLHRQFSDHLPATDGQEDRRITEHVRGCSRVRTGLVEPGW
ncbi:hypothetical protein ALP32_200389 [Pseudomonas avellanae]|uniref:Helicase C-terminal domain-containing protein n=1 Tax=Pseudomonas avellanae TaxID=46257 RepID=A0A3M5TKX2_9PSED|nr:hypothetical protein ALP32_200389 [Pseudomonas avellanae]